MKGKLLIGVVAALALGTTFAGAEKTMEGKAEAKGEAKQPMTKKKMKKHSHMEEKTHMPAGTPEENPGEAKKPLHEHRREHNKN